MASIFSISTATDDALLAYLASLFNGGKLIVYGGTVPATSDAAVGSATELRVIGDITGINFETTPVSGMIVKATGEVWQAENIGTAEATFWRFVQQSDDGTEATDQHRMQGSVDLLDGDMILGNINLVTGVTDNPISIFMVGLPKAQ